MEPFRTRNQPDMFRFIDSIYNTSVSNNRHLVYREYIVDGQEKYGVNHCEHMRFNQTLHPFAGGGTTRGGASVSPLVTCYSVSPDDVLGSLKLDGFQPPDMRAMAMAILGSKANDFSAINFLAELDELPSILTGKIVLEPIENSLKKKIRGKRIPRVQRDMGRLGVSLPLAQQFALGPLISDIASWGGSMVQATKRFNAAVAALALPQRFFGQRVYNISVDKIPLNDYLNLSIYGTVVKSAGGFVYGSLDMSEEVFRIKNTLDSIGLYLDGAVVWEAIPFSFLVDYVFPIGRWLEQARDPWVRPTIHSRDCWSITKVQVRFEVEWDEPGYWQSPRHVIVASGELKYFLRNHVQSIDLTPQGGFPQLRLPNPRQGAVVVGLALDKFFR